MTAAAVRERGIGFKDPLVLRIERGEKTQTRRLVAKGTCDVGSARWSQLDMARAFRSVSLSGGAILKAPLLEDDETLHRVYPKWSVGDRLWAKQRLVRDADNHIRYGTDEARVIDRRTGDVAVWPWKGVTLGAMYCPRRASRITLEVTEVRVERLDEITEEDAAAEGTTPACRPGCDEGGCDVCAYSHVEHFREAWERINGGRPGASWDERPWVWVVSFRRVC